MKKTTEYGIGGWRNKLLEE
jgi:hypothetical protein